MSSERPGGVGVAGGIGASSPPASESLEAGGGKLWGARAEFVASLGRKVADARDVVSALESDPSSRSTRDELRRRLHALGAAARLLRFDAMFVALADADAVLERAASSGTLEDAEFNRIGHVLDDLPALAWSEVPARERKPTGPAPESAPLVGSLAISALVFGGEDIAAALGGDDEGLELKAFECERTDVAATALDVARAIAPDVVVVDAELEGATDLVDALLDDPLTEPVPIVVLSEFRTGDAHARFVALGVAKVLVKPVSPEDLRHACEELVDQREGRTIRVTLGEPSLEQLGLRLAEEVRHALIDGVEAGGLDHRIPLGEGTEILGAIWGAIARVREVVTARTGGAVRFGGSGPEGAIALAPWLHGDSLGAGRAAASRGRGPSADVRLDGRRVVVADDDPGVTWFIGDLLRAAGCEVHEALDGGTALDLCYRLSPELVVSDILMPELDGFALARMLKHDVALRDTPIILLSWKEDLLQRVRELGAGAAAYLRKESDSRAILARVREVLRPRVRVETRLRGEGEVRGRLEGLTVHSLLELVCRARRSARISVRDAMYLHEVEIRDGAPRRATRTAADGSFQRGERVIAAMLGIGAGRFVVAPADGAIQGDLSGSLAQQIAKPLAAARGALQVVTGQSTVNVHGLAFDDAVLGAYLRATPEPMRGVIERLGKGISPRGMLLGGEVAPSVLEDVLADLAAHGAIQAVRSVSGEDLLGPAVATALAVIEGRATTRSAPPPALGSRSSKPPSRPSRPMPETPAFGASDRPSTQPPSRPPRRSPPPPVGREDHDSGAASSLADAVMRELIDRGTEPPPRVAAKRSLVDPVGLRPRDSAPSLPPVAPPPPVRPRSEPAPSPSPPPAMSSAAPESGSSTDGSIPVVEGTPAPSTPPQRTTSSSADAYTDRIILDAEILQTPSPTMAPAREAPTAARGNWVLGAIVSCAAFTVIANVVGRVASQPVLASAAPMTLEQAAEPAVTNLLGGVSDGGARDGAAKARIQTASTP